MRRASPPLTTPSAAVAENAPGMQPGERLPDRFQHEDNARRRGVQPLPKLPEDVLDLIVRRTIESESPSESARQLALLQRVDRGFRNAATKVLHGSDRQHIGRETTRVQIAHLARHSTREEFADSMRSIVGAAPDVGIRLQSVPRHFRETALQVLAEQKHLRSLELDARDMPDSAQDAIESIRTILPGNPALQHASVSLNRCRLGNDAVIAIAGTAGMRALTSLDIGNNAIDDAGLAALARSEHLNLSVLDISGNRFTDRGVTVLANSEMAKSLNFLRLRNNLRIAAQGVAALANSEKLAALDVLDLQGNLLVGDRGALALANSRHLRLKSLDLGGNSISHRGAMALAYSEMARSLTHLGLRSNYLGSRSVQGLADSDRLGPGVRLDFRNNRISDEDARVLRARFHHVKL